MTGRPARFCRRGRHGDSPHRKRPHAHARPTRRTRIARLLRLFADVAPPSHILPSHPRRSRAPCSPSPHPPHRSFRIGCQFAGPPRARPEARSTSSRCVPDRSLPRFLSFAAFTHRRDRRERRRAARRVARASNPARSRRALFAERKLTFSLFPDTTFPERPPGHRQGVPTSDAPQGHEAGDQLREDDPGIRGDVQAAEVPRASQRQAGPSRRRRSRDDWTRYFLPSPRQHFLSIPPQFPSTYSLPPSVVHSRR